MYFIGKELITSTRLSLYIVPNTDPVAPMLCN
jgi:hypothetical protein